MPAPPTQAATDANGASRPRHLDALFAAAVGALSLGLYLPLVPAAVLEGDPGEFQFAAYLAGIAHPTGYPLYCLLGWLWSHALPVGDAAYSLNLLSAVLAAVAVGLLCGNALRLTRQAPSWIRWPAAATTALAFATSPTWWSQSIVAEVYALNAAILAGLLLATLSVMDSAAAEPARRAGRLWIPALLAGFGLAHHSTSALFLPGCALALWPSLRGRLGRRRLAVTAVALLAPLLLYVYLPLRAPATPYLVQHVDGGLSLFDSSAAGLLQFVTGGPFGSALALDGMPSRLVAAGVRALAELHPIVWALAAAGAVALWRRQRGAAVALLCGSALQVAFNGAYDIGDIHVMYIPVYMWASVLAGAGITEATRLDRRTVLAPVLACAVAITVLLRLPQSQDAATASLPLPPGGRWEALLAHTPSNAILVSNDRNEIMPLWYYQYAQGLRTDLTGLFPLIVTDAAYSDLGGVLDRALATGREVYLIKPMDGLEVGYSLEGQEAPVRVLGHWDDGSDVHLGESLAGQVALLGYSTAATSIAPDSVVDVTLYWQTATALGYPYSTYVHVVRADGSVPFAGSDRRPGGDYYPATLWKPGQVIADRHRIAVPADAEPGTYRLIAGMYEYPSLRSLGDVITLGEFTVE